MNKHSAVHKGLCFVALAVLALCLVLSGVFQGQGGKAAAAAGFSDVIPGQTPYATAIAALAGEGIITGFDDGTFRPNNPVTRQQFAKMIVLTLGLTVTGNEVCPFTDVAAQIGSDPFYPSKYVAVCVAEGITTGKTAKTFDPSNTITHQQLITMVARAAKLSPAPANYTASFSAAQFTLATHYDNARAAGHAGLLDGLLGVGPTYNFLAGSTRGECAQLLYNLLSGTSAIDASVAKAGSSIGPEGGEVKLDDGTALVIPAGALSKAASVGLEKLSMPQDFGAGTTAYEITGLAAMSGTAQLKFLAEEGLTPEEVDVCIYNLASHSAGAIPYTYDPVSRLVTVTIGSGAISGAGTVASAGTAADPLPMRAQGLIDRFRILFTPEKAYVPTNAEVLTRTPYYQQSGGSCWAADAAMMIGAFAATDERPNLGSIMNFVKVSDGDFGLAAASMGFQDRLPSYIAGYTGGTVTWRGYLSTAHLKWRLLRELEAGHPVIYELNKLGHWVLIVGYRGFGSEFILQDSKAVKPATADDGGMYTVRSWDWLRSQKGFATAAIHIMWPETKATAPGLLSLGCPGADESGGAADWCARFSQSNPKTGGTVTVATLQFRPSLPFGMRWHKSQETVDVIPNVATELNLAFPAWNAGTQTQTADVEVRIFSGADKLFEWSQDSVLLAPGGYDADHTDSITVKADIETEQFRDLSKATKAGILPIEIDARLMQGGSIADKFTLRAALSVIPLIDKVSPSSIGRGGEVTITGSCFGMNKSKRSAVTVGGKSVTIKSWSDNKIVVQIPENAELRTNLPVVVTTGENYPYQSNPGTLSITNQTTIGDTYTAVNRNISGVLNAEVSWDLTGDNAVLDFKDSGTNYYSIDVKKDAPFRLTVTGVASIETPVKIYEILRDPNKPKSATNPVVGYHEMVYHQPTLYSPSTEWVLSKSGSFPVDIVSSSADSFTIESTITSYSQSLSVAICFRAVYDSREYDANMKLLNETKNVFESDSTSGTIYIQAGS